MSDDAAIAAKFRRLAELRTKRDQTKIDAEKAESDYRNYEAELFDDMEESSLRGTIRCDFGGDLGVIAFTPRETKFGRVIDADMAIQYFEQIGQKDEMLRPKLSGNKLNELVRERLEQGKPLPPGIDFYTRRGITISRKKS